MTALMKYLCVVGFVVVLGIASFNTANGAGGECGRNSPDMEAMKLIPCAEAASDPNVSVSRSCCQQIQKLGQNPKCLCAVMLSNTAKDSGAKPEVAVTIPKRCNLANRPVGYKCGPYTLP
ncbi:uncharacterized protein LOC107765337 [Nicotiana tabacum]|uniref:Uncharacterized protein LOC107765337 n=1 Tax=Nicotiana tabacum TaxID=4097 RepID=A0A1S3XHR3_TOBAC|nr:uncharacterized protein LOC104093206 [Nicotiana tomentosiformis]XP_016439461.1 PREDICTED: uncharacterized protein LOC107765337 [Nicotiana tabacum]